MWSESDKAVLPQSAAAHLLHIKSSSFLVSTGTFFLAKGGTNMLEHFYESSGSLRRLGQGLFLEHMKGLACRLHQLGYRRKYGQRILRTIGKFHEFVRKVGIQCPEEINKPLMRRFLDEEVAHERVLASAALGHFWNSSQSPREPIQSAPGETACAVTPVYSCDTCDGVESFTPIWIALSPSCGDGVSVMSHGPTAFGLGRRTQADRQRRYQQAGGTPR